MSSPDLIAGRYRLDSLLGRGGMGEVRAGTDLRLDREVAVKLLRADLSDQPELRARFEREARAAARISHPNVVAVFDTGEHQGVPYIVMERLPGTTLATELDAGPLTQAQVSTMVLEVLAALEAAHRLGVLHRDIKPGNILRAQDGHAKVADFGIAKVAEDPDPGTTGILFGTAAYLAPERLAGEAATPATDLYSVGVVLFEALAGRPPFQSDTPLGLVRSISFDDPPSLAALRPDVEPAVILVVEQAMAKQPGRRFDSASSMTAALTTAMQGSRPIDTRPTIPVVTQSSVRPAPSSSPIAPPPTEVLPDPAPQPGARSRPARLGRHAWRWLVATISLVAVITVLLAVAVSRGDEPASPSRPAGSSGIPVELRDAIDQLDQAVQP